MAKSIRSKIKRKHRAEFRRTFGTVAYNETMAKTQLKLKEATQKGSMRSFDRLADMLDTDGERMLDDEKPTETTVTAISEPAAGQNIAPTKSSFKKTLKRKHKLRNSKDAPERKTVDKPKPKYFCEF